MRLFDTHCHFETDSAAEIAAILNRAAAAGVEAVLAVGGSAALNRAAAVAAGELAGVKMRRYAAYGWDREQLAVERPAVPEAPAPVAVGEVGLDYHYSPATREEQRRLFAEQLVAARARNLPVIIHTREADDDTLAILKEIPSRGIIHSYTGTAAGAERYQELGFYISISGIVTFRAADNVRAAAAAVADERLLIETDSPFLAPVPMRGKVNEPAFLEHTCRFLAAARGMSAEALAELTWANAHRVLGLSERES